MALNVGSAPSFFSASIPFSTLSAMIALLFLLFSVGCLGIVTDILCTIEHRHISAKNILNAY